MPFPDAFRERLAAVADRHEALLGRPNEVATDWDHGLFTRYRHPVLTYDHTPLLWRYDLNPETNPHAVERLGVNAIFNPGAIQLGETIYLMCRTEGYDRKSFFSIAESPSGVDNFRFWADPVDLPALDDRPETNLYDMRLVQHEDGWIYGIFCTERLHPDAPPGDHSTAEAQCGLVRTKDLKTWERLPNVQTRSPQQRNAVLHAEFVDGRYAFYTRPQDDFVDAGSGGGIGFGFCDDIERPVVREEIIVDPRAYHTVKETKNGAGPAPIKTDEGWLHVAHGVRGTAAGLRYVLYAFLCDLDDPALVIHRPGGHLLAPWREERVGDVSNVLFVNGVVAREDGTVFLYYASSDTRIHVATTTVERLLDYVMNTPGDAGSSHGAVAQRTDLIRRNLDLVDGSDDNLMGRIAGHVVR